MSKRFHFERRTKYVNTAPANPTKANAPTPTSKFMIKAIAALAHNTKKAHFFQRNRKHTQTRFRAPIKMKMGIIHAGTNGRSKLRPTGETYRTE